MRASAAALLLVAALALGCERECSVTDYDPECAWRLYSASWTYCDGPASDLLSTKRCYWCAEKFSSEEPMRIYSDINADPPIPADIEYLRVQVDPVAYQCPPVGSFAEAEAAYVGTQDAR